MHRDCQWVFQSLSILWWSLPFTCPAATARVPTWESSFRYRMRFMYVYLYLKQRLVASDVSRWSDLNIIKMWKSADNIERCVLFGLITEFGLVGTSLTQSVYLQASGKQSDPRNPKGFLGISGYYDSSNGGCVYHMPLLNPVLVILYDTVLTATLLWLFLRPLRESAREIRSEHIMEVIKTNLRTCVVASASTFISLAFFTLCQSSAFESYAIQTVMSMLVTTLDQSINFLCVIFSARQRRRRRTKNGTTEVCTKTMSSPDQKIGSTPHV